MSRAWTCRKCGTRHPSRVKQRCECGGKRPTARRPSHLRALDIPYEDYVALNGGENCGACGKPPASNRRNDRDHDHVTGEPRGILCVRHNKMLDSRTSAPELRSLADYLDRYEQRRAA